MEIAIRPLAERDLPEADRIFRLAFGTFLGIPDPTSFMGDADLVKTRWRADPSAALGAYDDGALVGSNFAASWGSFGLFGPLTVRPDLWNRGARGGCSSPRSNGSSDGEHVRRGCSRLRRARNTSVCISASASGRRR